MIPSGEPNDIKKQEFIRLPQANENDNRNGIKSDSNENEIPLPNLEVFSFILKWVLIH